MKPICVFALQLTGGNGIIRMQKETGFFSGIFFPSQNLAYTQEIVLLPWWDMLSFALDLVVVQRWQLYTDSPSLPALKQQSSSRRRGLLCKWLCSALKTSALSWKQAAGVCEGGWVGIFNPSSPIPRCLGSCPLPAHWPLRPNLEQGAGKENWPLFSFATSQSP